jgi:hypothetical protein
MQPDMAGRHSVVHRGLEFKVGPDFWVRRLHLFPFFFESTNPSFRIGVRRVSDPPADDPWPSGVITFEVIFANGSGAPISFAVPHLQVGQSTRLFLKEVYTPYPGQTIIRLALTPGAGPVVGTTGWQDAYSYRVREEEQLWTWAIGPVAGVLLGAGATALGVFIQKWVG